MLAAGAGAPKASMYLAAIAWGDSSSETASFGGFFGGAFGGPLEGRLAGVVAIFPPGGPRWGGVEGVGSGVLAGTVPSLPMAAARASSSNVPSFRRRRK